MNYEITDITIFKVLTADHWVFSNVSVFTYIGTHGIAITSLLFACTVTSTMGRYNLRTDQYPCGYYIISCASSHKALFPLIPFLWRSPCLSHASVPSFPEYVLRHIIANESMSLPTHPSVSSNPLLILLLHLWSITSWKPIIGSLLTLWVSVSYWAFLSITFFVLK